MKLFFSPFSPYVRKVRVCAIERGLADRLELVDTTLSPVAPNDELNRCNPLGKIPALMLEDGTTLFDSRVICEYLDTLHKRRKLLPGGAMRWNALRLQALADGILDAAVITRYETFLRPPQYRWPAWIDGQTAKLRRGLDILEQEAPEFNQQSTIGNIAVACALGYLDFRFGDQDWRGDRPILAKWYERFSRRESMRLTAPAG